MKDEKMHFCYIMFHCFKKDSTPKEIYDVYDDRTITVQTVQNWFRRFRARNFNLKDEDRSGRPSTTDTDLIKAYLDENPRSSVREIADALNIPRTTIRIRGVGHPSTDGKQSPESNFDMRFANSTQQREPFLKKLITGDKSWNYNRKYRNFTISISCN